MLKTGQRTKYRFETGYTQYNNKEFNVLASDMYYTKNGARWVHQTPGADPTATSRYCFSPNLYTLVDMNYVTDDGAAKSLRRVCVFSNSLAQINSNRSDGSYNWVVPVDAAH